MTCSMKKADVLRTFFDSKYYPVLICILVFVGNVSGAEVVLGLIHSCLFCLAIALSDSFKPALISILTYIYQISTVHAPNYPTYSDYFYTGWRLPIVIIAFSLIIFGILFFFIKARIYAKLSFKRTPLLLPILIFSAALLLNGAFSSEWTFKGVAFAAANLFILCFIFIVIYHGLENESREGASSYLAYLGALIAVLVSAELLVHFLTSDNVFIDGSINKVGVALGWGIWNLVGASLVVVIPLCFLGAHLNRYPWLYFAAATLAFVCAALTMSRNALLFGALLYGACALISCFYGRNKKAFRIIVICGIVLIALAFIVFFSKIRGILADYFERGFSDNGRYNLWRAAFEDFLSAPIFGRGFYGFDIETAVFGPLPKMAHNTVLQLLSASGIFGLLSYGFYRIKSVIPLFRKPSLDKTFLFLSALAILLGSLLDNFIFNLYPALYYVAALAIIHKKNGDG